MTAVTTFLAEGDSTLYMSISEFYQGLGVTIHGNDTVALGRFANTYAITGPPRVVACNLAVSASKIGAFPTPAANTLAIRATRVNDLLRSPTSGQTARKIVVYIRIGTNPDAGVAATDYARLLAYIAVVRGYADAKGLSIKIIVGTIPSRTDGIISNFDTNYKTPYNALILAATAADGIDGVANFTVHSEWDANAAADNATYFSDKVHPTAALHAIVAPTWRAEVDRVVALP